jgi:hypothetical protein
MALEGQVMREEQVVREEQVMREGMREGQVALETPASPTRARRTSSPSVRGLLPGTPARQYGWRPVMS